MAHYPINRLVDLDSEDANSVDFTSFFGWFESREDLENETIREEPSYRDLELEGVRQAIQALLPNFSDLRVRRARSQKGQSAQCSKLVVTKGSEVLELGQLSHGERGPRASRSWKTSSW